ncbi:hypothetical protein VTI74DRAFT_9228 [Chaetomium olivicolor]
MSTGEWHHNTCGPAGPGSATRHGLCQSTFPWDPNAGERLPDLPDPPRGLPQARGEPFIERPADLQDESPTLRRRSPRPRRCCLLGDEARRNSTWSICVSCSVDAGSSASSGCINGAATLCQLGAMVRASRSNRAQDFERHCTAATISSCWVLGCRLPEIRPLGTRQRDSSRSLAAALGSVILEASDPRS